MNKPKTGLTHRLLSHSSKRYYKIIPRGLPEDFVQDLILEYNSENILKYAPYIT